MTPINETCSIHPQGYSVCTSWIVAFGLCSVNNSNNKSPLWFCDDLPLHLIATTQQFNKTTVSFSLQYYHLQRLSFLLRKLFWRFFHLLGNLSQPRKRKPTRYPGLHLDAVSLASKLCTFKTKPKIYYPFRIVKRGMNAYSLPPSSVQQFDVEDTIQQRLYPDGNQSGTYLSNDIV